MMRANFFLKNLLAVDETSKSESASDRRLLTFLILFGLFSLLFNLDGRSLENKDYLNYPEIAREILELDDWVMLHKNGNIYVEKPPLHFWKIAGSYALFGVTPFAARLPAALAALCGIFIAFFFGKRLFQSSESGFLTAMIMLSAYGYFWWARRTRIDMEFATLFSMSLVFFYCGCEARSRKAKALWYLAFWLSTGFAFMDKAFIALANLVVVVPYGVMCALASEERRPSSGLLALTSLALLLPILPWAMSLLHHHQFNEYWELLMGANIMRRREGFFYYFSQLPLKLLPATPFLMLGLWGYARYRRELAERQGLGFALIWIGAYLIILHLTVVKNQRYLLPIFLPCSLVSAWATRFFYKKSAAVVGRLIQWSDRILLLITTLSLISPFIVAWYYDISWVDPLPLVLCLALALILARIFLPLKLAGLFVSFVILFHVIEVNDTVLDGKRAAYLEMSQIFNAQGLEPGEIAFHDDSTRAREGVSFYFNRLIHYSDNWNELVNDSNIKGIVTTREKAQKKIFGKDRASGFQIVPLDKGLVLIVKRK